MKALGASPSVRTGKGAMDVTTHLYSAAGAATGYNHSASVVLPTSSRFVSQYSMQ